MFSLTNETCSGVVLKVLGRACVVCTVHSHTGLVYFIYLVSLIVVSGTRADSSKSAVTQRSIKYLEKKGIWSRLILDWLPGIMIHKFCCQKEEIFNKNLHKFAKLFARCFLYITMVTYHVIYPTALWLVTMVTTSHDQVQSWLF